MNTRSDSTEQELKFNLNPPPASNPTPAGTGGPKLIEALRLNLVGDPGGAKAAYLKLYGIRVSMHHDGSDQHTSLCIFDNIGDSGDQVATRGLTPCRGPLGDMYVIDGAEPTVEIVLAEAASLSPQSGLEVVFSYDYLPSEGFILARDLYLVEQEKLEQEIRTLQNRLEGQHKATEEYHTYQGSPLWKGFVFAERWYRRFSQAASGGIVRSCASVFRPAWWSRRGLTNYERWRSSKGYENKSR